MKIWLKISCFLLLVICVFLTFEIKNNESPYVWKRYWYSLSKQGFGHKKAILKDIIHQEGTKVVLIFGQSNAANYVEDFYQPKHVFYNYYKQNVYVAKEPLMNCSGNRGSLWTRFADKAITQNFCKNLILITIAEGNSKAEDWATGQWRTKLEQTLNELQHDDIQVDYIFWYQGESENPTTIPNYLKNMNIIRNLILKYNQNAPFICAITSYNKQNLIGLNGVDTNLQNEQRKFIQTAQNVVEGPNTDKYIYALDRYDGQHLSTFAADKLAQEWVECVRKLSAH